VYVSKYINTICKYLRRRNRKEIREKTETETDENEIRKKRRLQMKRRRKCEWGRTAVKMAKKKKK
jgi:hypothetical protein